MECRDRYRNLLKATLIVVPWCAAVSWPIAILPGFFLATGWYPVTSPALNPMINVLGFELVMIPFAPLMMFRMCLVSPEATLGLKALLLFLGAIAPLALALLFVWCWRRWWFLLVYLGYLAVLGCDVVLAMYLLVTFA